MDKISGKYLKELREERGYSLREFAEKVYASKSSVQRWEQSFLPENADVLNAVAAVFQFSVEEMRVQSAIKYGSKNRSDDTVEEVAASRTTDNAANETVCRQKTEKPQKNFTGLSSTAKCIATVSTLLFLFLFLFVFIGL